jgi:hypothetical protein
MSQLVLTPVGSVSELRLARQMLIYSIEGASHVSAILRSSMRSGDMEELMVMKSLNHLEKCAVEAGKESRKNKFTVVA